jgi:hypothetical protein
MLTCFQISRGEETTAVPMERCLLTIHLPSLGALPGGRRGYQTHVHGAAEVGPALAGAGTIS